MDPRVLTQFLEASEGPPLTDELRRRAPRHDRRLRRMERERRAILRAIDDLPHGGGALLGALLLRIEAHSLAEDQLVLDCYWQDTGGESGA